MVSSSSYRGYLVLLAILVLGVAQQLQSLPIDGAAQAVVVPRCSTSIISSSNRGQQSGRSSEDNAGFPSAEVVPARRDVIMSEPEDDSARNYFLAPDAAAAGKALENYIGAPSNERVPPDADSQEMDLDNPNPDPGQNLLSPKPTVSTDQADQESEPSSIAPRIDSEDTLTSGDAEGISEPIPTTYLEKKPTRHSVRNALKVDLEPAEMDDGINRDSDRKRSSRDLVFLVKTTSSTNGTSISRAPDAPAGNTASSDSDGRLTRRDESSSGKTMTPQHREPSTDRLKKGPRIVIMVDVFEDADGHHIIKPVQEAAESASPIIQPTTFNTTTSTQTQTSPTTTSTPWTLSSMEDPPKTRVRLGPEYATTIAANPVTHRIVIERLVPRNKHKDRNAFLDESSEDPGIDRQQQSHQSHQKPGPEGPRRRYYIQVDPSGVGNSDNATGNEGEVLHEFIPRQEPETMSPLEAALLNKAESIKRRIAKVGMMGKKASRN